ncbi:MAG TPA: hypothetical protein VGV69_07640 [Solirubrobacterales bacterium]|nr:hypothetical protein [Solirubrobacterales bacterium]
MNAQPERHPQGNATDTSTRTIPAADGKGKEDGAFSDKLKTVGGLTAVTVGVIAVLAIAIAAIVQNSDTAATIASSAGGVIATIVGAFFGVKIGTDQSKTAQNSQKEEAAKAQVYAAHLSPQDQNVNSIINQAEQAARKAVAAD